jgi:hypothetical protein
VGWTLPHPGRPIPACSLKLCQAVQASAVGWHRWVALAHLANRPGPGWAGLSFSAPARLAIRPGPDWASILAPLRVKSARQLEGPAAHRSGRSPGQRQRWTRRLLLRADDIQARSKLAAPASVLAASV